MSQDMLTDISSSSYLNQRGESSPLFPSRDSTGNRLKSDVFTWINCGYSIGPVVLLPTHTGTLENPVVAM